MDMFIKVVRYNYTNFKGRARRNEYWMFVLITTVISLGALVIDGVLFPEQRLISNLYSLAIVVPSIAVGARRLHDTGKSGWWQLLYILVIIGWIPLIIFLAKDSDIGDNDYGPSEKYPHANDSEDDFMLGEEE